MKIKDLEERSGQPARNIRHLIAQEVVPEPIGRTAGASYDESHLRALDIYTRCKAEGIHSLEVIRERIRAAEEEATTLVLRPAEGIELRVNRNVLEALGAEGVTGAIREALEQAAAGGDKVREDA